MRWIIEDSGAVLAITETREHSELVENLVLQEDGEPNLKGSPSQLRRVLEINSSAIDTLKFESWTPKDTGVPAELVDDPQN